MSENKIRAGLIPYIVTEGKVEMLFMKPSDPRYGGPHFQIAKGIIDPGENEKEAAIREAKEELGLFVGNIDGDVKRLMQANGMHTFYCKVKEKGMFGEPHYETGEVKWMTPEEFKKEGRLWQRPIVASAVKRIEKDNGIN